MTQNTVLPSPQGLQETHRLGLVAVNIHLKAMDLDHDYVYHSFANVKDGKRL